MTLQDEVANEFAKLSIAHREARNIALASVLEPLSEKEGCITRSRDGSHKSLEMFLAAGVNIYPIFHQMIEYFLSAGSAGTKGMYQFFPKAIALSKYQRKGSQINTGIIEFAFPIVAARAIGLCADYIDDSPLDVLDRARGVVQNTSKEDARDFIRGKHLAKRITQDAVGKKYDFPYYSDLTNVQDFYDREYKREFDLGESVTGVEHNRQFSVGFPLINDTFNSFLKASGKLSERARKAYDEIMKQNKGIGPGLVADFIAISMYLEFSFAKNKEVVY